MGVIVAKPRHASVQAIIGTAGHVDHGKTSLVKLLTGCDTDRLPEEKARGMSIDLGFAPCLLHLDDREERIAGIVDVPGHKDFIRNMVAGAASIDVLLLVVAADDGVMPQTAEHMQIVRLLRAPEVMVALTKIDMVTPDMQAIARADVEALLRDAGFGQAPIIPVSNKTGEGIGDIRDTLAALVQRVLARKGAGDARAFRMNVERVFSVKGYGTVVTGIPLSGGIAVGQKAVLLAGDAAHELAVRTIQTYKQENTEALANCCAAINVREIDAAAVSRGMTLAAPGVYAATREAVVRFHNTTGGAEGPATLERRFTAMCHAGTGAAEVSVKLLACNQLAADAQAFAHLVLDAPMVLAAGDRFILRALSPARTLGGGVILSAGSQRFRRHENVTPRLEAADAALQRGDFLLAQALAGPLPLVDEPTALRWTQQPPGPAAQALLAAAVASGALAHVGGAFLVVARKEELRIRLHASLERYHAEHPYTWGMTPGHLPEALGITARTPLTLAAQLADDQTILLRHGHLALAGFRPPVSEKQMKWRQQLLDAIAAAGVNAPARGNLMRDLAIPEPDMQVLEKLLVQEGAMAVLDGNFMAAAVFSRCRDVLLDLFASTPSVELAAYRAAIAANRKMAVALLDGFDAEGLTRRVGDGRVLAKPPAAVSRSGHPG